MKSNIRATTLRGVSYCRVSTFGQMLDEDGKAKEDSSPEAQRQRCIRHAGFLSERKGKQHVFVEHITDEGFSGKNTNRPGYQRMWDVIASGMIDFVISPELSRLSRNVLDFLELVSHCEKNKVDIIVIGLDLDTSTPFGRMMVVILMALAQFEREITSSRVKENALVRLLQDGKINGATEILGLDRNPDKKGHFVINEEERLRAAKILKLFQKFSSRKKTVEAAKSLGIAGKHGRELTGRMLDGMLDNVKWRYRGLWYANTENKDADNKLLPDSKRFQIVKLPHGPLLDDKILDGAAATLEAIRKVQRQTGKDDYVYLLKNVLTSEDGSKFQSEPSKSRQYRYYLNKKNSIRLRCDQFDPFVVNEVKRSFAENDKFEAMLEKAIKRRQSDLPKIEMQIRANETERLKLEETNMALREQLVDKEKRERSGFMDWLGKEVEQIGKRQIDLDKELEFLKRCRVELLKESGLEDIRAEVKKLLKDFDVLEGTEKRRLMERVVQRVVINKEGKIRIEMFGEPPRKAVTIRPSSSSSLRPVTLRNGSSELEVNGGVDGT